MRTLLVAGLLMVAVAGAGAAANDQLRGGDGGDTAQSTAEVLTEIRSLDGNGNNVANPKWGEVGTPYLRTAPASYADGVSSMVDGPDPRYVSNRIFNDMSQNLFSENGVTQWAFVWGSSSTIRLDYAKPTAASRSRSRSTKMTRSKTS
jgi:hypothetical protein